MSQKIIVAGGGIFGITSALELSRRGYSVTILDSGQIPSPLAASTDISKVIRMDYGSDELYMQLMEEALAGWITWNRKWGQDLFHGDGVMFLSREPMEPGGFEFESYRLLKERGHQPERMSTDELAIRFPAWNAAKYPDGYFNPEGGWAESGRVVSELLREALSAGVNVVQGDRVQHLVEGGFAVSGVMTASGTTYQSDWVIVAAGTWTPNLIPELSDRIWSVGQPVMHFRVEEPAEYQPPHFFTWGADTSRTGWYGFPALDDGTLKVANHGTGWRLDPDGPRELPQDEERRFRDFLAGTFPGLEGAPLVGSRMCFYSDTFDGNFWIDRHPDRPGLVVAAGGSGHGFKFAPVIGGLVADVVEGRTNPYQGRFSWRERGMLLTEEARYTDSQH